jgi:zinc transporter
MLSDPDEHPRLVAQDGLLGGICADFVHGGAPNLRHMTAWHFAMGPRRLVTARRRQSHVVGEVHAALRAGRRFPLMLHLFDALVDGFADSLAVMVRGLADRLDRAEDALLDRGETHYAAVGALRREAARLHRVMPPLVAMLRGIVARPPAWLSAQAIEESVEVARRVESLAADVAALQTRAHALHDEIDSRQSAETNQRLALLSVISALLMPPTLITGLFGMNVAHLPFVEEHSSGFPAALLLILVSVAGMLLVLRRLRLL